MRRPAKQPHWPKDLLTNLFLVILLWYRPKFWHKEYRVETWRFSLTNTPWNRPNGWGAFQNDKKQLIFFIAQHRNVYILENCCYSDSISGYTRLCQNKNFLFHKMTESITRDVLWFSTWHSSIVCRMVLRFHFCA